MLSLCFYAKAQTACFTTSAIKGCIPFTVTVDASCATNNTGTPAYYHYNYKIGGGDQTEGFFPVTTHTYNVAGTYIIRQNITDPTHFYDVIVEAIDPPAPNFNLTSCSGGKVSAEILDPIPGYDKYIIDFGDGSPTQTVSVGSTVNHVYAAEGFKSVSVTGVYNPNSSCKSATKSVYAINSVIKPDLIDLKVLQQRTANGSTQLRFNGLNGQRYRIEKKSGNMGSFSTVSGSTLVGNNSVISYTDANFNTQTEEHEYRIVAFDDCGFERLSETIATVRINATPNNAVNNIDWNTLSPITSYQLTKNPSGTPLPPSTATLFADNAITCGIQYCYQTTASLITTTLAGSPHKSYSIDTCIIAVYIPATPPVEINNLNSTMNGNTATITWNNPMAGSSATALYQSVNGGSYTLLSKPVTNSFSYLIPNTSSSYCFQVDYKDLCNNQSVKSKSTCPLLINGAISGTTATLQWNTYSGFDGTGVQSYIVQKLNEGGDVISEINVGSSTTFSETVNLTDPYVNYRIKVVPTNSAYTPVYSNNEIFTFEAQIFVPDIFTPNGDGTNELFEVKAKYIKTYSISIFSRWGEIVYASNSSTEGWDGMDKNVRAIEGAYTYKIIATDIHNKEFIQTGTITLTR